MGLLGLPPSRREASAIWRGDLAEAEAGEGVIYEVVPPGIWEWGRGQKANHVHLWQGGHLRS